MLFAVLPWGVRAAGRGGALRAPIPGAPQVPRVWMKLLWTTVVSAVIFAVCAFVYLKGLVSLDDLAALLGMPAFKP